MKTKDIISLIDKFKKIKYKYELWIVANVSETVQNKESFIHHTEFSEFFTKAEFACIISAISSIHGYIRIFYSEIELIEYVVNKKYDLDFDKILIYNFARDGNYEGKKSLIPAFCDLFHLKYIGSNPFVVSLLRNKYVFTIFLGSLNIPVPYSQLYDGKSKIDIRIFSNSSCIVKNIFESASLGLSEKNIFVKDTIDDEKISKLKEVMNAKTLLIQDFIEGKECEVFVIRYENDYHAFSPVEICLHNSNILSQNLSNSYDYSFSPLINSFSYDICQDIMLTSQKAAEHLNIKTYARFDFRIKENGEFYLIDIAGSPYLTRHSSITFLFENMLNLAYSDIFSLIGYLTIMNNQYEVNCKSESNKPLDL